MRFSPASLLKEWNSVRQFNSLEPAQRSIVFYAEDGGSWVHFERIIDHLTLRMERQVCYLTSSWGDPVLKTENPRLKSFCIGDGSARTSLFFKLNAGVMVMTMPDLETFHIKRSRTSAVHYVYVFHSMASTHMIYRKEAFDHFDSLLCVGPHHVRELRAREEKRGIKPRNLVPHGYGRLESILEAQAGKGPHSSASKTGDREVLIAPSWGPHGLIETKGCELVEILLRARLRTTVRPHPMTVRKWPASIDVLKTRFSGDPRFRLETDMSSQESLHNADLMISDWSGAALEYAFAFERPVLFIDVPRKINNPEYQELGIEPLEASIRTSIGEVLSPDDLMSAPQVIGRLCKNPEIFREQIRQACSATVFNIGKSGEVGARAIGEIADKRSAGKKC